MPTSTFTWAHMQPRTRTATATAATVKGSMTAGLLNMPTIMAFLTWFGGAGYIFTRTLGLGAIFAVPWLYQRPIGGAIMFVLLARLLWPMMSKPLTRPNISLPGTSARVVSPIRAGGVGEIVYTKGGSRFTAGARCHGRAAGRKGEEVVILSYERGIAYVQRVSAIPEREGRRSKTGLTCFANGQVFVGLVCPRWGPSV